MTTVSMETYYDTNMIIVSGHSGFAESGADIVCSAVSVLCYTLDAFLARCLDEGRISSYKKDFSEGYVIMDYTLRCPEDTGVTDGVEAITEGFRLLSESYPEYVTFDM